MEEIFTKFYDEYIKSKANRIQVELELEEKGKISDQRWMGIGFILFSLFFLIVLTILYLEENNPFSESLFNFIISLLVYILPFYLYNGTGIVIGIILIIKSLVKVKSNQKDQKEWILNKLHLRENSYIDEPRFLKGYFIVLFFIINNIPIGLVLQKANPLIYLFIRVILLFEFNLYYILFTPNTMIIKEYIIIKGRILKIGKKKNLLERYIQS